MTRWGGAVAPKGEGGKKCNVLKKMFSMILS